MILAVVLTISGLFALIVVYGRVRVRGIAARMRSDPSIIAGQRRWSPAASLDDPTLSPSEVMARAQATLEVAPTLDDAMKTLVAMIDLEQNGGGRRACGCWMSCDGMTTICVWPCGPHWGAELGGVLGKGLVCLGFMAVVIAVALLVKAVTG